MTERMSELLMDEFEDFAEGWVTVEEFSDHVRAVLYGQFTNEIVAGYLDKNLSEYFVKKTEGTVVSYAYTDDLDENDPFFAPPVPEVLNVHVTVVSPKQFRIRLG